MNKKKQKNFVHWMCGRTARWLLTVALLLCGSSSYSQTITVLHRATIEEGSNSYKIDVVRYRDRRDHRPVMAGDKFATGEWYFYKVMIYCQTMGKPCRGFVPFEESSVDTPLSAFRLQDNSMDINTVWAAGSAYRVRIYRIGEKGVVKVLEESSKVFPQFGHAQDGAPIVIMNSSESFQDSDFEQTYQIWKYRDGSYRKQEDSVYQPNLLPCRR